MTDAPPTSTAKRLSLCITDLEVGGAERCLVEIATRIDRARFAPSVVCLAPRPAAGPRSLTARLEQADVPVRFIGATGWPDAWNALKTLTRWWNDDRPEIVQSFLFHANILARIAAGRARVPTVISGLRVAERRRRGRLWLDRWTSGRVDCHVCVSQAVADFSASSGGLPRDRLMVIPNGIELDDYRNADPVDLEQFGLPPSAKAITFVGRLDRQKGLDWLLEAVAVWKNRLAEHHLLLVGSGPERAALARQCKSLEIDSGVHFVGWRDDVPGLLAASQLLVLPSRWEGMPNAVLEAMAAGRAVVASDVEGVRELLGPAGDDQIVRFGDTQSIVEKVVTIATSPALCADLGRRNAVRAAEEFGIGQMVQRYERLFWDLSRR